MAYQITPQQTRFNDPFSQTLFQFNLPHSNLYLSNPLNSLSRIFGDNIILNGLELDSASISEDNIVTVTITKGFCIVDHIFHELLDSVTLSLDVSGYDDQNGKLAVFANYQFLQTPEVNPLRFKLCYVSNDGSTVRPIPLSNSDKILVTSFTFDLTNHTITESTDSITINGKTFLYRGYDPNTTIGIGQFLQNTFSPDFGYY